MPVRDDVCKSIVTRPWVGSSHVADGLARERPAGRGRAQMVANASIVRWAWSTIERTTSPAGSNESMAPTA